jgi:mono/diheme cytochrome c family protein
MRRLFLAPALALALTAANSAPAAAQADGKALFEKNCTKCHGADGSGDTPAGKKMKVPRWDAEDLQVDKAVKTVRENKKHKTVSKKLSDEQLQAIGAHVATLGGGS